MMWIVRECDLCNAEPAAIMCDHCGCKVCVCCATLLVEMIEDQFGGRYKEICNRCVEGISDDGTVYNNGPKLVLIQGGKGGKSGEIDEDDKDV